MQTIKTEKQILDQHRQDVIWQIWLPVGIGAILVLALGILSILSLKTGTASAARWSHVATIWLILPFFLIGLFCLLLVAGLIALVIYGKRALNTYAPVVIYYIRLASTRLSGLADRSVRPVIEARSGLSIWERLWITLRLIFLGGYKN